MQRNLSKSFIEYKNGIVAIELRGVFNQQSAEDYQKALFCLVMKLNYAPFALLADISRVEGATPEAFDIVKSIINRLPEFGLVAKAYVYRGPVIKGMMFQRIPELEQLEYSFFTDIEVASDWLTKEYQRHISSHS
ncbi:hypothetical protein [Alteromonas sp. KUL106]|uniref:hypothetical protein n=1 Tax=Alteromonas sp. KUL106 TaxID=2480799 RepID=UPI0012E41C23|nr:hypothetical protein [Alteromonas sp. KUL106]GFD67331.1 hypothetical protein KUL106_05940 [Alteromonas sp. KUL106]GFD78096.1 hypothetical protein KUL118_09580 [Tenacibaculum sp. KUL118]